jgi:hypothetical protein
MRYHKVAKMSRLFHDARRPAGTSAARFPLALPRCLQDSRREDATIASITWLSGLSRSHLRRHVPLKQFIYFHGQPLHFHVRQVGMFDKRPQPFEAKQGTVLT